MWLLRSIVSTLHCNFSEQTHRLMVTSRRVDSSIKATVVAETSVKFWEWLAVVFTQTISPNLFFFFSLAAISAHPQTTKCKCGKTFIDL